MNNSTEYSWRNSTGKGWLDLVFGNNTIMRICGYGVIVFNDAKFAQGKYVELYQKNDKTRAHWIGTITRYSKAFDVDLPSHDMIEQFLHDNTRGD